jgi:hypothetical protein
MEESMYSFLHIGFAQFYSVEESMYSFLPIGWRSFIQWRRACIPFFLLASAVLFTGGEHVFLSSLLAGAFLFCG